MGLFRTIDKITARYCNFSHALCISGLATFTHMWC